MEQIEYRVLAPDEGQRLDAVIAKNFTEFSRAQWQAEFLLHPPTIDGNKAQASSKLKTGQSIGFVKPNITVSKPVLSVPQQLPEVLYEDNDVIVINKPAGLLTHPTERSVTPSVAAAFASKINDTDNLRPGIVHRLDRDTSGVMILAKNPVAKEFLQSQFKARKVKKDYIALVTGSLSPQSARLELPLARSKKQPNTMVVSQTGRPAISEYKVIASYPGTSLVEVNILTGRTHQIRVQFAHLGHPIVGDVVYNHNKPIPPLGRQFLHSNKLTITLPNGEQKTFVAPLPYELKQYLENL